MFRHGQNQAIENFNFDNSFGGQCGDVTLKADNKVYRIRRVEEEEGERARWALDASCGSGEKDVVIKCIGMMKRVPVA
ncbi:hypothetical protein DVH05_005156 [Phytophthora capsici]|nr:hypothetical protein DVH05_005156 [Phytophthora capsici]